MFTKTWAKDTGERVARSIAAVLITFFGADISVMDVDYSRALGVSLGAGLVTFLFCVLGGASGVQGTASFTNALRPNTRNVGG